MVYEITESKCEIAEMNRNTRKIRVFISDGECKLYGVDDAEYPKHHFYHACDNVGLKKFPLQVAFAGSDEVGKNVWRERKNSDTFSLEWVKKGEFKFTQNGKTYICPANSLFIVHKNMDLRIECNSDYAVKWTISLDGLLLLPTLAALSLDNVDFIPDFPDHKFNELYQKIFLLTKMKNQLDSQRMSVAAYELLLKISQHINPSVYPEKLRPALYFIEANIAEKITVEALAKAAKICTKTLNMLFLQYYGLSPMAYVISARMKLAQILLADKKNLIKDVALRVGYSNPLYFSSEFKKHQNLSPENFRKKFIH